jgi:UDP-glucose 4-epimerase
VLFRSNTLGTLKLLEAIRTYSRKNTKIVFSSSLQVYAHTPKLALIDESQPLQPENVFGTSKRLAEDLVKEYHEEYGIPYLICRLSNVYGPGCRPHFNSVIATFIDLISKNKSVPVYGGGKQTRDYIYVDDVVGAFVKSLAHPELNDTLNICTGVGTSANELVCMLEKIMKTNARKEHAKGTASGDNLVGDPSKARTKLGFKCKVAIKDGLKTTVAAQLFSKDLTTTRNKP